MPYPYYTPMAPRQTGTIYHVPMQGFVTPFGGVTALPGVPPSNGALIGGDLYASMMAARPIVIFSGGGRGGGGGGGGAAKKAATTTTTTTPPPADKPATTTTPPPTNPPASVGPVAQKPYVYYNPLDGYLYTADPFTDEKNARMIMPFYQARRMQDDRVFDMTPGSGGSARQGRFLGYIKEADYNATATPGWKPSNVHPLSEYPNGFNPINQQPGVPAQKAGPAAPPSLNPAPPTATRRTNPNNMPYFGQDKPLENADIAAARQARESQNMYADSAGMWNKDPIMGATQYRYNTPPATTAPQMQAFNQPGPLDPAMEQIRLYREMADALRNIG